MKSPNSPNLFIYYLVYVASCLIRCLSLHLAIDRVKVKRSQISYPFFHAVWLTINKRLSLQHVWFCCNKTGLGHFPPYASKDDFPLVHLKLSHNKIEPIK